MTRNMTGNRMSYAIRSFFVIIISSVLGGCSTEDDYRQPLKWPQISFISESDSLLTIMRGERLREGLQNILTDFRADGDKMVHVSSFCIINDTAFVTYYANRKSGKEDPESQIARFVKCSINNPDNKVYYDIQGAVNSGLPESMTVFDGHVVDRVYDTILLRKDDNELYLMWTASLDGEYFRLYQSYKIDSGTLGPISYNYFVVGQDMVKMSISSIEDILNKNNIWHKPLSSDVGIMQKLSTHFEDGVVYYYTGCYAGAFNCIIKSSDLINWEYVATPDFDNYSQYENSVYVKDNKAYCFIRQDQKERNALLTYYDLSQKKWHSPQAVNDAQSRSDFFEYNNNLYLIHSPYDRNHLSIMKINTDSLGDSHEVLLTEMNDSFYPYTQVCGERLYISFTQSRQHIYLSSIDTNILDF